MALSAFDDKSKKPKARDIQKTLGRTGVHWNNLIEYLAAEFPPLGQYE